MLDLGRNDCLADVLDVLQSARTSQSVEDAQAALQAMSLIPRFKSVTPDELSQVRSIIPVYFKSKYPWVRATLVSTLRQIGDPWAAEQLRNALAAEQEAYVRASIKSALTAIESK